MEHPKKLIPLVSIVLATYNGKRFIKEQLDSIINQTYKNIEIIAVDDCSTDNTYEILKEYEKKFNNFHSVQNEKNLGFIKNFEKAITLSNGEFIALSDQDDVWDENKIMLMMSEIKDCCMAFCDSEMIDENGKSLNKKLSDLKIYSTYNDAAAFLINNSIYGHAMLFTKQLALNATPFPAEFVYDWWLAFNAVLNSPIKFVNKPLVKYRQHNKNYIGAVKIKGKKKIKTNKIIERKNIRARINAFYKKCPDNNAEIKKLLFELNKSYQNFSVSNNWLRMKFFFRYRKRLLVLKKRSDFRKKLFCLKMFFEIA